MQGPHKSLCPFPFNDKEVITGLRYQGRHLPLIPPSQSHLRHSGPPWAQGGGSVRWKALHRWKDVLGTLVPHRTSLQCALNRQYILPLTSEDLDSRSTCGGNHKMGECRQLACPVLSSWRGEDSGKEPHSLWVFFFCLLPTLPLEVCPADLPMSGTAGEWDYFIQDLQRNPRRGNTLVFLLLENPTGTVRIILSE